MNVRTVDGCTVGQRDEPFYPTGKVFINRMPGPDRPFPRTAYITFAADSFGDKAPTALRMGCTGPVYPVRPKMGPRVRCNAKPQVERYEAQTPCSHFPQAGTYLAEARVDNKWTTVALVVDIAQ